MADTLNASLGGITDGLSRFTGQGLQEVEALVDEGFEQRVGRLAQDRGLEAAAHQARQVTPEVLQDVDLVLVLAREHTQPLLQQAPRLLKKVFTLREFARILQYLSTDPELDRAVPSDRAERWAWLVQQAPRLRQRVPVRHPERNDVIDPYRQEDAVLQQMADELFEATDAILAFERRYAEPAPVASASAPGLARTPDGAAAGPNRRS